MSLLVEAMKKAEELQRQADEPASASPQPHLSLYLDAVDADPTVMSAAGPRKHPALSVPFPADGGRGKEGFVASVASPRTGGVLWSVVCAGLLAMLGVVGYFWWQLRAVEPPPLAARPSAPNAPVSDVASAPPVDPPAPPAENPTASAPSPPVCASAGAASAPAETPPRLTRAVVPPADIPLEHAYQSLQSGRDEEARRAYEHVLQSDGKNTDALLGLATLATRRGEVNRAHGYYLRALETDPTDSTARAGALSLGGQDDADTESRLTEALDRQPDSPSLHFALGNLYARQRRWSEAQQAYFEAYVGEPDNPDLIFNLAVSLDHLRQDRLAAQYYRMALSAADTRTAAFDPTRLRARLLELQP
jgi:Tfp pilus assembly protein PilF